MFARYAPIIFFSAILFGGWGAAAVKFNIFPYSILKNAQAGYTEIKKHFSNDLPWYMLPLPNDNFQHTSVIDGNKIQAGLTLVTGLSEQGHPHAKVIDRDGNLVHYWSINWFKLWQEETTHIAEREKHKFLPGPHIHGVSLMENGDLVFSMERAALFRLSACGDVRWKLPQMTHHALFVDEDKNLWVPSLIWATKKDENFPAYKSPFKDFHLLKISPEGKIIKDWRLFDILHANNLDGYLYMGTLRNDNTYVSGDTLHFNDVDVYPSSAEQGFFKAGDVMLSLRNINAVMVFDSEMKFKTVFSGPFVRQHDPDFVSSNSITLFDNGTHTKGAANARSRIMQLDVNNPVPKIMFEGSDNAPFFTDIMGKHQLLENGNILITESTKGRAFEVSNNQIVWEHYNQVGNKIGLMDEAQRLPAMFTKDFFTKASQECQPVKS